MGRRGDAPPRFGACAGRAVEDLGGVGRPDPLERRVEGAREGGQLSRLARILERFRGKRPGRDAGPPQLVERAMERAMEPDALAELSEIRVGLQDLVAGRLHDGEKLRPRKQAAPVGREERPGHLEREREQRRGPEVQVREARARQRVEDLRADRERRDEEDLLVDGVGLAERGELLKEPVAFDGRAHAASLSEARSLCDYRGTWKASPSGCRR